MPIMHCDLCPRRCHAQRRERDGDGFCGVGTLPRIARAALHHWEEPCISGTRGSGAIFFSGCSLQCLYCQNSTISHGRFGESVSIARLRAIMEELTAAGAHNINLVNPTHFARAISESLAQKPSVPVVYNTGGYDSAEALSLLEGKVQVYLPDVKTLDASIAQAYHGAADYPAVVRKAVGEMVRQTGPVRVNGEGLMTRGVMIRHLVLPGQARAALAVLDWIMAEFGHDVWLSLMCQYTPPDGAALPPPLRRKLTTYEYQLVADHMLSLGYTNGYTQQRDAAAARFVPAFDLTGVRTAAQPQPNLSQ